MTVFSTKYVPLTVQERINLIIMRGFSKKGDNLFTASFPDCPPIAKSTVHRTVTHFDKVSLTGK